MATKPVGKKVMVNGPNARMNKALKAMPYTFMDKGSVKASNKGDVGDRPGAKKKATAQARAKVIKEVKTRRGK